MQSGGRCPHLPPMSNPLVQVLRAIGRVIATVLVAIWVALDELLFPLVRPLIAWLGRLPVFAQVGALIGRLPPYVVLVLLAVPFVLIEPVKIFALYLIATGLPIRGIVLLAFAHLLSILTLDRIYHAGRGQLMKIAWFARLMAWLVRLRDRAFGWVKASAAWRWAATNIAGLRAWVRRLLWPAAPR